MLSRFRIERRLIRGEFRWTIINPEGRYVGSAPSYLSAFKILQELNREVTPERAQMFKEKTRGESYR